MIIKICNDFKALRKSIEDLNRKLKTFLSPFDKDNSIIVKKELAKQIELADTIFEVYYAIGMKKISEKFKTDFLEHLKKAFEPKQIVIDDSEVQPLINMDNGDMKGVLELEIRVHQGKRAQRIEARQFCQIYYDKNKDNCHNLFTKGFNVGTNLSRFVKKTIESYIDEVNKELF